MRILLDSRSPGQFVLPDSTSASGAGLAKPETSQNCQAHPETALQVEKSCNEFNLPSAFFLEVLQAEGFAAGIETTIRHGLVRQATSLARTMRQTPGQALRLQAPKWRTVHGFLLQASAETMFWGLGNIKERLQDIASKPLQWRIASMFLKAVS